MARLLLLVSFICFVSIGYSQNEVLFKVITYSDGVTIDGKPAVAGMNVGGAKKLVVIPADGQLGVINKLGEPILVVKSTTAGDISTMRNLTATGAVHHIPSEIDIYPDQHNSIVIHDSIFFHWKVWNSSTGSKTSILITDLFQDSIARVEPNGNYAFVDLKKIWGRESNLLLAVRTKFNIREASIRKGKPHELKKIESDLQRLPMNDDRLFLESAVYYLDQAAFEGMMCLYKIMKSNKESTDPILKKYYDLVYNHYNLEEVKLN